MAADGVLVLALLVVEPLLALLVELVQVDVGNLLTLLQARLEDGNGAFLLLQLCRGSQVILDVETGS